MQQNILFILALSIVLFVTVGLVMTGPDTAANPKSQVAPIGAPAQVQAPSGQPSVLEQAAAALAPSPAPIPSAASAAAPAGSCGSSGGCGCGGMMAPRPATAPAATSPPPAPQVAASGAQVVSVRAETYGYDHPQLQVKAGTPVEFHFSADPNAGCGRQLILDGFNVNLISQGGADQVATFTPTAPGTYNYHCGMNMFRGTLTVTAA